MIISLSCQAQVRPIEKALKLCINKKLNENSPYNAGPDFYKTTLDLEQLFIKNKCIDSIGKKEYYNFLFKIINEENDYEVIYHQSIKILDNSKFPFGLFTTNNIIFNQCPNEITSKYKNSKEGIIDIQSSVFSELMEENYSSPNILKKLFDNIDEKNFNKIVYRAPIILVIIINLDLKYNPDIRKLEEFKRNKKFLEEKE